MDNNINRLNASELGILFPIIIENYNPGWVNLFQCEKELILNSAVGNQLNRILHIGSTSVPGLCAKPTVDILIEIPENANCGFIQNELENIEYQYIPKPENPPPHAMFAKGYSVAGITGPTFHIHLRFQGDHDEVVFRDFLTANVEYALKYCELKRKLASGYHNDREGYTDAKGDFIRGVIDLARKGSLRTDKVEFITGDSGI